MELERVKRALAITTTQLSSCMDELPTALTIDAQLVWDCVSVVVVLWALARLIWDATHHHPNMFPLDRLLLLIFFCGLFVFL